MNDIINIKEKFKVDDSHSKIRGFVCAYDEEGRLVFSKENMIVESGRRFILNNGINEESLKYVFLSENGTAASPRDLLSEMGDTITTDYIIEEYDASTFNSIEITHENFEGLVISSESELSTGGTISDDKNYFSYIIDRDQLVIKCLICFNDKSPIAARSLGIVVEDYPLNEDGTYNKSEAKVPTLFSRVTFPTYYKSNNQRLTFKYYIYF